MCVQVDPDPRGKDFHIVEQVQCTSTSAVYKAIDEPAINLHSELLNLKISSLVLLSR